MDVICENLRDGLLRQIPNLPYLWVIDRAMPSATCAMKWYEVVKRHEVVWQGRP